MERSSNQSNEWWEEKTGTVHSGHPPRAAVFLRSLAPPAGVCQQQDTALERLQTLDRQGVFEAVDVTVWGKAISPDSTAGRTEPGRNLLEIVDEFRSWVTNSAGPNEGPFEETSVSCSITDEHYRKIVLPQVCLAVYSDDQLELVLPCEVDGDHYSVAEFLDAVDQWTPVGQEIGTSA